MLQCPKAINASPLFIHITMADLSGLVKRLVIAWVFWVGALSGLVAWTGPVTPAIILGGASALWITSFLLTLRSPIFRGYINDWYVSLPGLRFLSWLKFCVLGLLGLFPKQPQSPATYNPNLANTIITLLIATISVPFLYWKTWNPELNHHVITLERDTVVSSNNTYIPGSQHT
jgi:hypothetical protein